MSRTLRLVAAALATVAVAVAAPLASAGTGGGASRVDPLAVGYLQGLGLSPIEVQSWTVGACSQAVKAPSCYDVLERAILAKNTPAPAASAGGFDWGDAGIGAGATLGLVLLLGGLGATLIIRHGHGGGRHIVGM